MASELNTGGNTGLQTLTQTPQSATQAGEGGTKASSLQPGTATSVLSNSPNSGVPLGGNQVSTVSLAPAATASTRTATVVAPAIESHPINPAVIAFPVALLLLGLVITLFISRSAKNTTYY